MNPNIRFYGTLASLAKWRELVTATTGVPAGEIEAVDQRGFVRHRFAMHLTADQRRRLQDDLWYAPSGTGETATGVPYRWNLCVTFELISETPAPKSKAK